MYAANYWIEGNTNAKSYDIKASVITAIYLYKYNDIARPLPSYYLEEAKNSRAKRYAISY